MVYSASLRAETWRVSGRDMEHAVVDDEERADGEECLEGLDEARAELEDRDQEQVTDERPFAAVPVRDDTEDDLCASHRMLSSSHIRKAAD